MDPLAGAASGTDPLAWVGLAIALVLAANFGLAEPIRLTLYLVIAYVLLANATAVAPALNRFTAALGRSGVRHQPNGSRVAGGTF